MKRKKERHSDFKAKYKKSKKREREMVTKSKVERGEVISERHLNLDVDIIKQKQIKGSRYVDSRQTQTQGERYKKVDIEKDTHTQIRAVDVEKDREREREQKVEIERDRKQTHR